MRIVTSEAGKAKRRDAWALLDRRRAEMLTRARTETGKEVRAALIAEGDRMPLHTLMGWFEQQPEWEGIKAEKKTRAAQQGGKAKHSRGYGHTRGFVFHNRNQEKRIQADRLDLSYLLHRRLTDLSAEEIEAMREKAVAVLTHGLGREKIGMKAPAHADD